MCFTENITNRNTFSFKWTQIGLINNNRVIKFNNLTL